MTNSATTRGTTLASAEAALRAVKSWPSEAARVWTLGAVASARDDAPIDAIIASGSAVRDVARSDDLDLVLVYRRRRPELTRPPIDVDLRQYERAEVLEMLEAGHDYISWTVRFGRSLFERDGWWAAVRSNWDHRLALPSADAARVRAHKTERLLKEMRAVGDRDAACELEISMLTHLARAVLSEASVFPESRPELPDQLRDINEPALAARLDAALSRRYD